MKKCNKCNKTKPLEQFGRNSKNKDRLNTKCRDCISIINRATRLRLGGGVPITDKFHRGDKVQYTQRTANYKATDKVYVQEAEVLSVGPKKVCIELVNKFDEKVRKSVDPKMLEAI